MTSWIAGSGVDFYNIYIYITFLPTKSLKIRFRWVFYLLFYFFISLIFSVLKVSFVFHYLFVPFTFQLEKQGLSCLFWLENCSKGSEFCTCLNNAALSFKLLDKEKFYFIKQMKARVSIYEDIFGHILYRTIWPHHHHLNMIVVSSSWSN
jgi:hypothetical protein